MKILQCQQGSETWDNARRIRPTCSRFSEIFTAKKADLSASADKYAAEIVTQQLFDQNPDPVWLGNANTDNGNEREPAARKAFTELTGLPVEQVGFCIEDQGFYGGSPDFLIPGDGPSGYSAGGECKCPLAKTHIGYLVAGTLPEAYVQQVMGSMYVTGLREWHFFSHFPSLPSFHLLVKWDPVYGAKMAKALDDFRILYAKTRIAILQKLKLTQPK